MIHYSFREFFIVIGIATFFYLGFILLRYYRKEMNALLSRKAMLQAEDEDLEEEIFGPSVQLPAKESSHEAESEDFKRAEVIILKIKEVIIYAAINNYDHTELYQALKTIIGNYPLVMDHVIRDGITELIIHECEKHGTVKPQRSELDAMWEMASA